MKYLETLREWTRRAWGTFRRTPRDSDLERELEFHLEMAEEELRRQGHPPQEAARLARLRFGRVPRVLQALHDQRGLPWLGRFSLDVTLGLRMLRKSWGLTVIGGLAMVIAIAIAAGGFSFVQALSGGPVPLDEGDRVVAIQMWSEAGGRSRTTAPEDFERWRDELRSVEDVGAFRTVSRSLALPGQTVAPGSAQDGAGIVSVAEMTAAGFRLARVPPLLGRPLVNADERAGADPVVVIGHAAWRYRFSADSEVVGRRMRLDGTVHTVVGVMPEDFAFPINQQYWVPLRTEPADQAWDEGPEIFVFGRLSSGATLETAQTELEAFGLLPSTRASGGTGEPAALHPRIMPYTKAFLHIEDGWSELIVVLFTLLLIPPCANIAILVYARTVVRQEEFAMRFALGASRGRIVAQLFIEMLVLSAAAAAAALVIVHLVLMRARIGLSHSPGASPFWMDLGVSTRSALYVGGLAMVAAAIAGAVPALQATSRLMQSGLRTPGAGGMRLGKIWSALIVAQVALAVLVLPMTAELGWGLLRPSIVGTGFAPEEYMTARVQLFGRRPSDTTDDSAARDSFALRFAEIQSQLIRRLEADAGVSAVAVSQLVPGAEPSRQAIQLERIEGVAPADDRLRLDSPLQLSVAVNRVERGFFDVFDVPLLAGREFGPEDFAPGRDPVLINRTFAEQIIREQDSPLGRRVRHRYAPDPGSDAWYEIVGVVANFPANDDTPRMYHPMTPGLTHPVSLLVGVNPGTEGVAGRLAEIARSLDPALAVDEIRPLDSLYLQRRIQDASAASGLAIVTLSVLLLSAAGMYALMSFTVNQRRREIGIRSALGAQPRRLLAGIFRRALGQIGAGAVVGLSAAYLLGGVLPTAELGGRDVPGVLPAAGMLFLVVGALAAAGPARRALRVAPTEALREGG